jgi:release factor glutamine methyltransferase
MSAAEPWTVGRLLQWTADYLKGHGSESPRLDAEVLLAHVLGRQRIELYTTFDEAPGEEARAAFRELVRRRAEGMPVAYLVGHREFYSLSFRVTSDVLIPRPETELLVVAVLDLAKTSISPLPSAEGLGVRAANPQAVGAAAQQIALADVGTGSGVIAVCLAKHLPACRVTAIDISPAALLVAADNAKQHGVAERIEFLESDLFAAVPAEPQFDFIVSNPPYVTAAEMEKLPADVRKFEPPAALLAGPRGTEVIERLLTQSAERLRPGGHLLIEISPMIHDAVRKLLEADGRFELGPTIKDLARLPRVVQARRRGEKREERGEGEGRREA